jgi:hypothetical protein
MAGEKLRGRRKAAEAALRPSFWAQVDMLGECWVWTGARTSAGYGHLRYGGHDFSAHRCSFELTHGALPADMFVCHRCDNPPCVNPAHLFLGSPKDNTADMHRKGRASRMGLRGEASASARTTDEGIIQIRLDFARGATTTELSRQFGYSEYYIRKIVKGKAWEHVGGPIQHGDLRAIRSGKKAS